MINNIVTQRFVKCHNKLRETKKVKSSRQFAMDLEYLPQSLSEILKGRRDVTIEVIRKAVEVYKFNPVFLFTGEGELFITEDNNYQGLRVLTVVTDTKDDERIIHVPIPAYSGYVNESNDATFIQTLPSFTLPDYKYKVGTHRCFDVAGDSMEPTLFEGDKVVCSFIEPALWETALKDSYVYVIVTKDDVMVSRVTNHLKTDKTIEVHSDNSFYETHKIPVAQIREIWYVRAKISPFLPSPNRVHQLLFEEMSDLKNTIKQQTHLVENLSKTIEKMIEVK
jgi:phage repressor protein C with HTH and peptisase S24 domain